jgi:hypothetical protein
VLIPHQAVHQSHLDQLSSFFNLQLPLDHGCYNKGISDSVFHFNIDGAYLSNDFCKCTLRSAYQKLALYSFLISNSIFFDVLLDAFQNKVENNDLVDCLHNKLLFLELQILIDHKGSPLLKVIPSCVIGHLDLYLLHFVFCLGQL